MTRDDKVSRIILFVLNSNNVDSLYIYPLYAPLSTSMQKTNIVNCFSHSASWFHQRGIPREINMIECILKLNN